ncbi:DUF4331 domain-containing protein [Erythrobacter sp. QSSC1-22B]|uniref:DUF4331 domain-containing protein n=1 Tax=Erythrobacter sp. QSSC1-22B TaxID=1860125 RepID=UPI000B1B1FBB|nr:DUF4331 domain-containing protein [Erythrobacter sp. QSSC1-22B]
MNSLFTPARRRKFVVAPLVLSLGLLSACFDGNDDDGLAAVPPPVPTPVPTPTPTPASFNVSPCLDQVVPGTGGVTVAQAVVPDTLTLNLAAASGFPNGRKLPDPVIDVTLAVIFLDLTVHGAGTLAGLPLNPPANDVPFRAGFPFLAQAQGSPPQPSGGSSFGFRTNAPSAYVRVDRMGMPAVATALIGSDQKIPYNDANPADDAAGTFVPELVEQLTGLTNALADDLVGAGLTPCAKPS